MKGRGDKRRRKRGTIIALLVVAGGSAIFLGLRFAGSASSIPTAAVKRGLFVDRIELHGQVKALQSVMISAPPSVANFRILKLVANGAHVKRGQVLVKFDPTQLRQTLAQDRVALKSAEASVQQARAKARIKEEKDVTTVQEDRYNVGKARLEASKAEIVSRIQGEENKLKLADAEQQLVADAATLKDDRIADAADIRAKQQSRDQALYQVRQDEQALAQLTLRAPHSGVVSLLDYIWNPSTQSDRSLRPGDHAWPGAPIAEMPNLSMLEVVARVDETERGRLSVGQQAEIRFPSIPNRTFTGRIRDISTIASADLAGGWPIVRNFTVWITLNQHDSALQPKSSGTVRVAVRRVPDAIEVPTQAVFRKNGERIAYVLQGTKFTPRPIVVDAESNGQALVAKGLKVGERVALKNPEPHS